MEVLPCSGVQYVGEADCSQPSSGMAFTYDGESNSLEHGKQDQLADRLDDLLLNVEGPQIEKQAEVQGTVDELPTSEGHCSGASYCGSHDFEDDEPCMVSENSHIIVDTIEGELPNNREEESSLSEPTWLEGDESVALWVKVNC